MANVLDLRLQGSFTILVTRNVTYSDIKLDFKDFGAPSDLVISIPDWGNSVSKTFTIGNGLSIQGTSVIWNLGMIDTPKSSLTGTVKTTGMQFGSAVNLTFTINVS